MFIVLVTCRSLFCDFTFLINQFVTTPTIMAPSRTGRIRPHERETNDTAVILGADIAVLEEHSASVRDTELQHVSESNKRDYRNRLGHIFEFLKEQYPAYYAVGVRALTEAELANPDMY